MLKKREVQHQNNEESDKDDESVVDKARVEIFQEENALETLEEQGRESVLEPAVDATLDRALVVSSGL
ncbi:hypothetical protein RND71_031920 [Anisodus tanguticus]|uniref:Uncharacterized protein n=1 Tax=Anisodus tanguticus TaxID=243964 RepID=A0AAE1V642_9SOLA|nr:hypothetical protein RND71_031920 [Anisodus tanguticus]